MSAIAGMQGTSLEALRRVLHEGPSSVLPGPKPGIPTWDYAVWRLLHAWKQSGLFAADQAVLLRQVVRWFEGALFVGSISDEIASVAARAGVQNPNGYLHVEPFARPWMQLDGYSIDSRPQER